MFLTAMKFNKYCVSLIQNPCNVFVLMLGAMRRWECSWRELVPRYKTCQR